MNHGGRRPTGNGGVGGGGVEFGVGGQDLDAIVGLAGGGEACLVLAGGLFLLFFLSICNYFVTPPLR